jgi:hypothetical protein
VSQATEELLSSDAWTLPQGTKAVQMQTFVAKQLNSYLVLNLKSTQRNAYLN